MVREQIAGNVVERAGGQPPQRLLGEPIPAEGENGLFTRSWFPLCLSDEVQPGEVVSRSFLDGHVAIFRGDDGAVRVTSPFCPHLGADLTVGTVVGNRLRCAFHHWEFGEGGRCEKVASGDPIPGGARLFVFPSTERYGLIWAFNGVEADWPLPDLALPEDELSIRVRYDVPTLPVDPWVICCNTPDWQHIKVVHRVALDSPILYDNVAWTDHSMTYSFSGRLEHGAGEELAYNVGIHGSSIFLMDGLMGPMWYSIMTPFGLPSPGQTQVYFVTCLRKADLVGVSPEEEEARHLMLYQYARAFTADDRPILRTIRFRPGLLTRSDRTLARYLDLLRAFPRSHPAADFMK